MSHTEIKTFEDACAKLGYEEFEITFPEAFEHQAKAIVAHAKLVIIAEALNDGWKPDWKNGKWDKYYPWFNMDDTSAVGGFSCDDFVFGRSFSTVGSRLCYKSAEIAEYAGQQFEDLYREYFVIE